jgi:hypothetical protein
LGSAAGSFDGALVNALTDFGFHERWVFGHRSNYEILKTSSYSEVAVCWLVVPCSLIEIYRRFRGATCIIRAVVTAQYRRRLPTLCSTPWERWVSLS